MILKWRENRYKNKPKQKAETGKNWANVGIKREEQIIRNGFFFPFFFFFWIHWQLEMINPNSPFISPIGNQVDGQGDYTMTRV